jgi:hypothetical protein
MYKLIRRHGNRVGLNCAFRIDNLNINKNLRKFHMWIRDLN